MYPWSTIKKMEARSSSISSKANGEYNTLPAAGISHRESGS